MRQLAQEAEFRAKEREKILTDEELHTANDLQAKANARGMKLVPEKKIKNNFSFAQFMQRNWAMLREEKYFTSEEKLFLVDISTNVSLHSNAIVDDIKKSPPMALNIQQIADLLGTSRPKISRVVNSLIKKGILAKSISGEVNIVNQAKDYVLFVNPHVIYVGERDSVKEHLVLMFTNQMKKNKTLKKLPHKFF